MLCFVKSGTRRLWKNTNWRRQAAKDTFVWLERTRNLTGWRMLTKPPIGAWSWCDHRVTIVLQHVSYKRCCWSWTTQKQSRHAAIVAKLLLTKSAPDASKWCTARSSVRRRTGDITKSTNANQRVRTAVVINIADIAPNDSRQQRNGSVLDACNLTARKHVKECISLFTR